MLRVCTTDFSYEKNHVQHIFPGGLNPEDKSPGKSDSHTVQVFFRHPMSTVRARHHGDFSEFPGNSVPLSFREAHPAWWTSSWFTSRMIMLGRVKKKRIQCRQAFCNSICRCSVRNCHVLQGLSYFNVLAWVGDDQQILSMFQMGQFQSLAMFQHFHLAISVGLFLTIFNRHIYILYI